VPNANGGISTPDGLTIGDSVIDGLLELLDDDELLLELELLIGVAVVSPPNGNVVDADVLAADPLVISAAISV
jgi:hypothetical protein